jgi:hypothetical protein
MTARAQEEVKQSLVAPACANEPIFLNEIEKERLRSRRMSNFESKSGGDIDE